MDYIIAMTQPALLFHCMTREAQGDCLMATCEREVNGRTDKFLYATPYFTKALAFSFDYYGDEIICNGDIDGTRDEMAIICNRDHTMTRQRPISVYAFSSEGFESVGHSSRQLVSTRPVPFKRTGIVFQTSDVRDIMKRGLQIFSTNRTIDDLMAENFHDQFIKAATQTEVLFDLVTAQGFAWENYEHDLNPTLKLIDDFQSIRAGQKVSAPNPAL
jgi:hypothetical protein